MEKKLTEVNKDLYRIGLTLFDMGGGGGGRGMLDSQNVFDHCAQTLQRRKLKLGDF